MRTPAGLLFAAFVLSMLAACGGGTTTSPASASLDEYVLKIKNVLNLSSVVFLDANESTNTVDVGISDPAATSAVMNFAGSVGVPSSVVRTVAASPFVLRASVRDRFRPLVGGIEIRKGLLHACTLGAIAMTASGASGIVTNS